MSRKGEAKERKKVRGKRERKEEKKARGKMEKKDERKEGEEGGKERRKEKD